MKPLVLALACASLFAELKCNSRNNSNHQKHFCKISEQSLAAPGRLSVDGGRNGGVSVHGWSENRMLVRARIDAWAETESEASLIGGQVQIGAAGAQVKASGPESKGDNGWAVSYEIFVPRQTNLSVSAHNGGVNLEELQGQISFSTHNGGVNIKNLGGDVKGSTHNGGVHVELAGGSWQGGGLNVETHNGGVRVNAPREYAARFRVETRNGGISSDFPMPATNEKRPRSAEFNAGAGGPLLALKTVNGGVSLKRR
ncbi:MAG: hypothetical protein FJW32_05795 [Acidobacteria bacterium]|nr:hypothetical protein [Acidobacteriota bacterium]